MFKVSQGFNMCFYTKSGKCHFDFQSFARYQNMLSDQIWRDQSCCKFNFEIAARSTGQSCRKFDFEIAARSRDQSCYKVDLEIAARSRDQST